MKEKIISQYTELVKKCERFELKGKNNLYTSANGHMFSSINKAGEVGFRFSKDVQERYFKLYSTSYFISYGAKMKGYILITEEMWQDLNKLATLLDESYDYVMSLKAK